MKNTLLKVGAVSLSILSVAGPFLVLAQGPQPLPPTPINSPNQALTLMCTLARWAFIFLMVLAVIFIIWAAFNYLRAGGDPDKVKEAGNQLIYAAIAVAVALFARGFPLLIGGFLTGGSAGFDITQYGC